MPVCEGPLLLHRICWKCYDGVMVTTREQALEIAARVRAGLEKIYGQRLRGVYLYGSAARESRCAEESDIDIAVVLDEVTDSFAENSIAISELRSEHQLGV